MPLLQSERRHLYDDVDQIPVYHLHRKHLRPWDRQLPETVEAEGDRRQRWTLKPPTPFAIYGHLIVSISVLVLVGVLPYAVNAEYCRNMWDAVVKPKDIYKGSKTLLAMWIVTHIANGFAMWLVWLGEGFEKHQVEVFIFGFAVFAELMWLDCVMFTKHLDYGFACWIVSLLCTVASQIIMCFRKVGIAAAFLLPYDIVCIVMLSYIAAFMRIHGSTYEWIGQ